jgi:replication-associated recombination protein RarA
MNLESYTTDELLVLSEYLACLQRYRVGIQKALQNISKLLELRTKERKTEIERLLSMIENNDTVDAGLDEFVHDTASETAGAINNSGLEQQLNWLLDRGCSPDYILRRLIINVPKVGLRGHRVGIGFLQT